MPCSHFHDLWTNTCGLTVTGSRRCTWFWDGRSCMCNEVWKVWEGRQSVRITLKEFENVSVFSNCTECKNMVVSQDDHTLYLLARCWFSLSRTHHSRHWLHGIVATFMLCLLFRFCASLAHSSSLHSQFLPFWRRDNKTASAATFNCIPKLDRCLPTSHTFSCIPKAWQKSNPQPAAN